MTPAVRTAAWQRARVRAVLAWAALLLGACAIFTRWPSLDLWITARFHDGGGFAAWQSLWWVQLVYQAVPWLGRIAVVALLVLLWTARHRLPRHQMRRAAAVVLAMVLGVGLVANAGLKEHWGRPRPMAVRAFGGTQPFQPALKPSALCHHNCSFVSGHAATGFALMAVGLFAAPARRRRWWWSGVAVGMAIGVVRIVQGGHFASDVVFSGLGVWGVCLVVRGVWLRHRLWKVGRLAASTTSKTTKAAEAAF